MKLAKEIRDGVLAEIMGRVGMNELELLRDSSPPVWNGLVCEIDRIISAKLEPVRMALDAVTPAITSIPHDSSVDHRDAWVYGILLGWSGNALDEVLDKHGWRGTRLETDLAKHRAAIAMLSEDE